MHRICRRGGGYAGLRLQVESFTELLRSCLWLVLGVYTLLVPSSRILLVRFSQKLWKVTTMNRWRCAGITANRIHFAAVAPQGLGSIEYILVLPQKKTLTCGKTHTRKNVPHEKIRGSFESPASARCEGQSNQAIKAELCAVGRYAVRVRCVGACARLYLAHLSSRAAHIYVLCSRGPAASGYVERPDFQVE